MGASPLHPAQPRPQPCKARHHSGLAGVQMLQKQGGPLETNLVKAVAVSVARGMTHLHKRRPPLLHLDLKARPQCLPGRLGNCAGHGV